MKRIVKAADKIIVALDTGSEREALAWVDKIIPHIKIFKVGSVLFTSCGPRIIKEIRKRGGRIFLDLKFHDIPGVVARAVEEAAGLDVELLTIHTLGGEKMLKTVAAAVSRMKSRPKILGVTILTSLEDEDLKKIGLKAGCVAGVKRLARLAIDCGLDGVVASAREVKMLRKILPSSSIIVTPGIRAPGHALGDQKRVMTPREAVKAGADYLVIGRPITMAKDPRQAVEIILEDING